MKTILLTMLALLAFAGNSVLCKLALNHGVIDAASFTSIRLLSGAIFLFFLVAITTKKSVDVAKGSWKSALFLFLYAGAFSYAYISLDTGTGALILFAAVQLTMIIDGLLKGNRLVAAEWMGLLVALAGLCVLLMPGASAPSLFGFVVMTISGIAWGLYTLAGRGSQTPLLDTANNFLRTLPLIAALTLFSFDHAQISASGIVLAIASGGLMSGLGYAVWYTVLTRLTLTQAATFQLTVPIIAALGGVIFAHEAITLQLIIASLLVLGGVLVVTLSKQYAQAESKPAINWR